MQDKLVIRYFGTKLLKIARINKLLACHPRIRALDAKYVGNVKDLLRHFVLKAFWAIQC